MKYYQIYCDHCGKVIDEMKDYPEEQITGTGERVIADLCRDCFNELFKRIKDYCDERRGR